MSDASSTKVKKVKKVIKKTSKAVSSEGGSEGGVTTETTTTTTFSSDGDFDLSGNSKNGNSVTFALDTEQNGYESMQQN